MSYEIVKRIRIENNTVYVTAESNNVYPKYYRERESSYFNEILRNDGIEALNLSILKAYEEGNFQEGVPNKWSRAIDRLRALPEYQLYSWRNTDFNNPNCPVEAARKTKEFDELLLNSLTLKLPSEKYIIQNTKYNNVFVGKITKRLIKSVEDKAKAKVFRIKQEAEMIVSMFPEKFKLIQIN